ncbi:MAG: NADase-type glycan-binding domain-containing protein [Armatimonadota bacterium]
MRRIFWLFFIFLLTAGMVCADGTRTGITWPGWRVETSEVSDAPGYPITFMFDSSAKSAWVHHFVPDPKSFESLPRNPAPHGVGATISISCDAQYLNRQFFTIDGLGIINGYAKDSATYWRNNRIRAIRVHLRMKNDTWGQTFSLRETREVQRISFPRQSVSQIEIEVVKVDQGQDDDLCISELMLFNRSKRIPWNLTPVVLYNPQNDCGCGGLSFSLMHAVGTMLPKEFAGADQVRGVTFQPGTSRMLLSSDHTLNLYDFATRAVLYQHKFRNYITELSWMSANTAYITTSTKPIDGKTTTYRFSSRQKTLRALPQRPATLRPVSGSWQPNFGA